MLWSEVLCYFRVISAHHTLLNLQIYICLLLSFMSKTQIYLNCLTLYKLGIG